MRAVQPPVLTPAARLVAAGLFGALARLRGDRPLHPTGAAFEAELIVDHPALPGVALLETPGRRPAYVRFSRGFGLPEPLPEILSLAVKVPDAYGPGRDQDLLMTATGEAPVLRHAFAAGRSHLRRTYSTVFPFSVGGRRLVIGAVPRPARRAPAQGRRRRLTPAAALRAARRWRPRRRRRGRRRRTPPARSLRRRGRC